MPMPPGMQMQMPPGMAGAQMPVGMQNLHRSPVIQPMRSPGCSPLLLPKPAPNFHMFPAPPMAMGPDGKPMPPPMVDPLNIHTSPLRQGWSQAMGALPVCGPPKSRAGGGDQAHEQGGSHTLTKTPVVTGMESRAMSPPALSLGLGAAPSGSGPAMRMLGSMGGQNMSMMGGMMGGSMPPPLGIHAMHATHSMNVSSRSSLGGSANGYGGTTFGLNGTLRGNGETSTPGIRSGGSDGASMQPASFKQDDSKSKRVKRVAVNEGQPLTSMFGQSRGRPPVPPPLSLSHTHSLSGGGLPLDDSPGLQEPHSGRSEGSTTPHTPKDFDFLASNSGLADADFDMANFDPDFLFSEGFEGIS